MSFQTNQVSTINVDSKTITLVSTPRRGEPICCANRWCWFSFVSGWGRGII